MLFGFFLSIGYIITRNVLNFFRIIFSHPVMLVLVLLALGLIGKCMPDASLSQYDIRAIMVSDQASVERYTGTPMFCEKFIEVTCSYGNDVTIAFDNNQVSRAELKFAHGTNYHNDREFYQKILTMLNLPYREPDHSNIDNIVWDYPGVGEIDVSSNNELNIDNVIVSHSVKNVTHDNIDYD